MTNHELQRALNTGLTVEELIEELQTMDPNAKVVFEYISQDYWRTPVARVVDSVDEGSAGWSAYHQLPTVLKEEDVEEDSPAVVVLNLVLK